MTFPITSVTSILEPVFIVISGAMNNLVTCMTFDLISSSLFFEIVSNDNLHFLFSKKQTGQLNAENGFDVEMAIKQVQAGDTNVTFAVGEGSETLETKLNALISYLMNYGEGDFICYRQIKW